MSRALVMGASGFLGSQVVKALAEDGRDVRIMVRASSDTRSIDHLDLHPQGQSLQHRLHSLFYLATQCGFEQGANRAWMAAGTD